jgi:hypothetical protein
MMQPMTVMNDEVEKFAALKHRLVDIWGRLRTDPEYAHT